MKFSSFLGPQGIRTVFVISEGSQIFSKLIQVGYGQHADSPEGWGFPIELYRTRRNNPPKEYRILDLESTIAIFPSTPWNLHFDGT